MLLAINKKSFRSACIWLGATAFAYLVRNVYYLNAHNLTSVYFDYLCLIPGIAFVIYFVLMALKLEAGTLASALIATGFPTLTCYLLLSGIYDMADTYHNLVPLFLVIGIIVSSLGLVVLTINIILQVKKKDDLFYKINGMPKAK
ncbi:MAG: hypothetical protein K5694_02575 [Bacilli bacterium]|nr:hypothetical protein [Bacilli bacterium]